MCSGCFIFCWCCNCKIWIKYCPKINNIPVPGNTECSFIQNFIYIFFTAKFFQPIGIIRKCTICIIYLYTFSVTVRSKPHTTFRLSAIGIFAVFRIIRCRWKISIFVCHDPVTFTRRYRCDLKRNSCHCHLCFFIFFLKFNIPSTYTVCYFIVVSTLYIGLISILNDLCQIIIFCKFSVISFYISLFQHISFWCFGFFNADCSKRKHRLISIFCIIKIITGYLILFSQFTSADVILLFGT